MCQTPSVSGNAPVPPAPEKQELTCSLCPGTSKYKCPKCGSRSCSLSCVKAHKEETGCDGKRDKTKFLPLTAMKDMDVVSDFRLLEEVTRGLDKCRRDTLKRSTRQGTQVTKAPRLHKHLARLQQQARGRGVRLRLLPPHFARRKANTSVYDFKERQVKWRVELVFPHCQQGEERRVLPLVSERSKLWRLVEEQVEGVAADSDPFLLYKSVGYGGLSFFLKAEGMPGPGEKPRQFYPMDMKRSLKTNLKNTSFVEHPIIHVVFRSEECNYREDQDYAMEEERQEEPGQEDPRPPSLGVGDVLSETDAMAADPEAYKQYFDFYLKYYSAKYNRPGSTVPPAAAAPSHPAQLLLPPRNNTFPTRSSSNPFPPSFTPNYTPDFNRAPTLAKPPPPAYPARSTPALFSTPPPDFSTPPPNFSLPPPAIRTPVSALNARNSTSAQNIQSELKKTAGLGLLAAYGSGSDSDSD